MFILPNIFIQLLLLRFHCSNFCFDAFAHLCPKHFTLVQDALHSTTARVSSAWMNLFQIQFLLQIKRSREKKGLPTSVLCNDRFL